MMTIWQSVLLGVVQGLTEFLPVSSKGHLLLVQTLFQIQEATLFFDVLLHVASLLAMIVYFWPRWKKLSLKTIGLVIAASMPVILVGLLIEPYFEQYIKQLSIAGFGWLITGGLLLLANKRLQQENKGQPLTPRTAIVTGLFQVLAFLPGVSRSGSTLSGSLLQGVKREDAFSFAFLLAVPAILGAFILQVLKLDTFSPAPAVAVSGFVAALLTSFLALKLLDHLVVRGKLHYFAYYCFLLGTLVLAGQVI